MGNVLGLYAKEEEEIPLPDSLKVYVSKSNIRLSKKAEDEYFSVSETGWLTEKMIPKGTSMRIRKIIKNTKTGQIRVLAQVDQESALIDVSKLFYYIFPPTCDFNYLRVENGFTRTTI